MLSTSYNSDLTFTYDVFQALENDELSYFFRGSFSQSITEGLISLTESNLNKTKEPTKIKKKVYFIMVESLQNIIKHQDKDDEPETEINPSLFIIQKNGPKYFITSGNVISVGNINSLQGKLDKINSLSAEDLKQYYLEVLECGEISEKGGAGLGLIDMAKKSGNKLSFDFSTLDNNLSYFYLQTSINSEVFKEERETVVSGQGFHLENIKTIHNVLNNQDINLIFRGVINQETLVNLFYVIREQLAARDIQKRTISVIIELLQNIIKHGHAEFQKSRENSGIFIVKEEKESICLLSGNYIRNHNLEELKTRIEEINAMSPEELQIQYNKGIFDQETRYNSNAGLGLLKLRMKSRSPLKYNVHHVDAHHSFITFQVIV